MGMTKIKLHEPHGKNRWCGPAVLSILTGISTDDASRFIREKISPDRRMVTRTYTWEILCALSHFGIDNESIGKPYQRATLAKWLRESKRPAGNVYLVIAANHWQIVTGRRYICGITKKLVSIKDPQVKRRGRIDAIYLLSSKGLIIPPELKQKKKSSYNADYHKARRLAKKWGITIDIGLQWGHEKLIWLYAPEHFSKHPEYPLRGGNTATDWTEVREHIETIIEWANKTEL